MPRIGDKKDFLAGLLFLAFACGLAYDALQLQIGTARRMGPGYFPLVLALALGVLGLAILARAVKAPEGGWPAVEARGAGFVLLAILVFALTVKSLGFIPSVAATVIVCALASQRASLPRVLGLVAVLMLFCWIVFIKGLGMPIPLFGQS